MSTETHDRATQERSQASARQGSLRALLFDLDDVLFDGTIWRRWLVQLLGKIGHQVNYQTFFQPWDQVHLEAVCRRASTFDQAFRSFLSDAGLTSAQVDEVAAAGLSQCRHLQASLRPFPGVRGTLARLKQSGCRLAVVATSPYTANDLCARLRPLGLDRHFDLVASSFDRQRYLLDTDIFRDALHTLQVAPETAAFVGHDSEAIRNARGAGLCGMAFNFDRDVEADVHLRRFDDLYEMVDHSAARPIKRAA
ncbi:MAG: HAD family hydrolase [Planctomycetes bacterium]|nr:HAD family hydrolase [Planctomycetota bacterium]